MLPDGPNPKPLRRRARARTVAMKRLSKAELKIGALLYPERGYWRPRDRADCDQVPRPCPYVGCRHNLFLDINATGGIKLNRPDGEPWDGPNCALDLADERGRTTEAVGAAMNLTRERVRQIELRALERLREALGAPAVQTLTRRHGLRAG